MEVNKAIATRSSAQFFSHSYLNTVALNQAGPSKGGVYSPTLIIVITSGIHAAAIRAESLVPLIATSTKVLNAMSE